MTAWSGLFDGFYRVPYTIQLPKNTPDRGVVAQLFRHRGMQKDLALIVALLGASAGGTATSTYKRVKDANAGPMSLLSHGGKQLVETVTEISRATTSADVTELKSFMFNYTHDLTLVKDKGGNSIKGVAGQF